MKKDHAKKQNFISSNKINLLIVVLVTIGLAMSLMAFLGYSSNVSGAAIAKPQCNDQKDNDGDGYCDYSTRKTSCRDGSKPGDVDCTSSSDNKEAPDCEPVPERCDGTDNNCNSQIDEGLPIACTSASSCGTSGWTGINYCGADGNVYQDYTNFQCNYPSTCSSSCASQTTGYVYETCSNGCENGACRANDSQPTASASANPTSGVAPLEVIFSGLATSGDLPLAYSWNFGDGTSSTVQNPSHTYSSAGTYAATFTVTDADGDIAISSATISVSAIPVDLIPSAIASASPTSGVSPLQVDFSGSVNSGDLPLAYSWNFGDGTSSTVQNQSHTYSSAGTYTATFTATDADGDQSSDTVVITVAQPDLIPSVTASVSPSSGTAPLTVTLSGSVSSGNSPFSYSWNFGDGTSSTVQNPSHTYSSAGTYTATFTATDSDGDQSSDTVLITVNSADTNPAADATASPTSGNASLTVGFTGSVTSGNEPFTYFWDFKDGLTSTSQNPQHTFSQNGTYAVLFRVTDADGDVASDSVTVNVKTAPYDFSVVLNPTSNSVMNGATTTSTITVNRLSGTSTNNVVLFMNGCPPYSLCTFGTNYGIAPYSTPLTVVTSYNATTPPGTYTINVIGSMWQLPKERTATYTLVIN